MCDVIRKYFFESSTRLNNDSDTNEVIFCKSKRNNVYVVTINDFNDSKIACLSRLMTKRIYGIEDYLSCLYY